MRSPVIAFGIFAAATVVSSAPTSPNVGGGALIPHLPGGATNTVPPAPVPPLPLRRDTGDVVPAPTIDDHEHRSKHKHSKRALDGDTAGGNAYSGGSSNSSGGSVINNGENDPDDTITNDTSNAAGIAGTSVSGDAVGGRGRNHGPGGNAYTGGTGNASGGAVVNDGGDIANAGGSNAGGEGNASTSGEAIGGDAKRKRAMDQQTAGGNAYTGSSGDAGSGNIINDADADATTTNVGMSNTGDIAGTSTTGDAIGGQGGNKGPGGNAYSGYAGPTRGGTVVNNGGSIDNAGMSNIGGDGNDSASGDALGGDARR